MAINTPKISEIDATLIAQLEASLAQAIPILPKSWLRVLTKALSGLYILLYRYAGFIFLQMFVASATIEPVEIFGRIIRPLIEWGRLIGVGDPTEATQAQLTIDIVVTNQSGQLDSGTQLVNATNGVTYLLNASVLLDAAIVIGTITAQGDQSGGDGSGTIGNLAVSDTVEFANPLANVNRTATVTVIVVSAADKESETVYRNRVIDRFRKRLQGGALVDYEAWGEETAGIINLYPYTGAIAGHIDVYSEATVASSGSADGIPTAAQLAAVAAAIELDDNGLASRRPAGSFVNSFPITRKSFVTTISGLVVDNPVTVQAEVIASVLVYFAEREPFVSGVTSLPRTDMLTKNDLTTLVTQIVLAAGGLFSSVSFTITGSGTQQFVYTLIQGEKAKSTVDFI